MYQKQNSFFPAGELPRDFRCDDGLAAAAGQHDAGRTVARGVGGEQLMQQLLLIRSQFHQNGRSSSVRSGASL